jgi:tetratricopeptide (TPR) repeat protein
VLDKSPIAAQIRDRLSLLQLSEAQELAASLISQEAQNYEGYFWAGFVEFQLGSWYSAVRHLRQAEKLRPPGNAVQKVLGLAYLELGQNLLFQLKMKEAIGLDPADFSPHYCLARYLQSHKKHHEEAAKHYRLVVERKPDHYEALYYLGLASEAAGDMTQAKALYQRAPTASAHAGRTFSLPYQGLSRLDRLNNLPESALKFASQAVSLEPKLPDNQLELAKVYVALGRLSEAVDAFKSSLALDPTQSSPYYQLFTLYRRLGDGKAAEQALAEFKGITACYGKDE